MIVSKDLPEQIVGLLFMPKRGGPMASLTALPSLS